jgi:hypothetical protein
MRVSDFVAFIEARERHRIAKERGWKVFGGGKRAKPDSIISQYRFCNVRRNDDRVTQWVHKNYLKEWADHEHLWFALVVARLFNEPNTLDAIKKGVLPFKPEYLRTTLKFMQDRGDKVFNAAYIVSTNGRAMNKIDYVIDLVLKPLWAERKKLSKLIWVGQLANAHIALMDQQGLGSFMAAQVLADLKYAERPHVWEDFATFAASGPGSKRGLNRIFETDVNRGWSESLFRSNLAALRDKVNARLKMEPLTAQDVQNCLCEFDKYERARLGEGRPKQKYTPAELPWKEE